MSTKLPRRGSISPSNWATRCLRIDVAKVREVLDFTTITEIPRTPDFMSGVINLRGSVVPVVDLRLCFEMSETERTRNTCIVVVEVLLEAKPR